MEHVHTWRYAGSLLAAQVPASLVDEAPNCDRPTVLICSDEGCGSEWLVACSSTRASRCRPCAKRYRGRVAWVARSGRRGGREGLFITLTAPGQNVHPLPSGEVCRCTPEGGTDLALWNASCSERWRRLIQWMRRAYGDDVQYFRATETQKRGALHFHVLFRREDGGALVVDLGELRAAAIRFGFGHEVDVQPLEHVRTRAQKAKAGRRELVSDVFAYVAKYVAKAADSRGAVPWKKRGWITRTTVAPDGAKTVDRVWDWQPRPTYRTWVASRRWGDSMLSVRQAQAHCSAVLALLDGGFDWFDDAPDRPACEGPAPRVALLT